MKKGDFKVEKLMCINGYKVSVRERFDSEEQAVNFINLMVAAEKKGERHITWSVEDFRQRALEHSELEGKELCEMFDENKFESALNKMIDRHDCHTGITLDTVAVFLYKYCKKETTL